MTGARAPPTQRRTRSREFTFPRATQRKIPSRTGRADFRESTETETPRPVRGPRRKLSAACSRSGGEYCRGGRLKFRDINERSRFAFYTAETAARSNKKQQNTTSCHTGSEGRSFRCPVCVAARRVNPQECRRRRDPLSTGRSSTKPCGRSRSGTRAYPPSAPVLTDPCGKQFFSSFFAGEAM